MWQGLFAALLEWLTALARSRSGTAGTDAAPSRGCASGCDRRLAEWRSDQ